MLRHQASRLKAVIVDLRQIMKNFQHLLPQHCSPEPTSHVTLPDMDGVVLDFEDCLKPLAKALFDDSNSEMERHDILVSLSYVLYRFFPAEAFQALGRTGDKLHQAIVFLGRLHTSSRVLIAAARQIPGFDNLSLIPVVGLKSRRKPASQEWSPAKTFQSLNLQLSDAVIEKLMEPSTSKVRWTKTKLLNDFSRLKSPTWEVHAEIQLIVFVLSHPEEIVNGKRFEYIGCSRYSCVLCSQFLHFFQALKTRGCHGKLYNHSWTVPLATKMGKDEQKLLSEAVTKLTSWMRKQLKASTILRAQRRLEATKESTIGGSLIAIPGMSQGNRQQSEAASEYLRRQRAQNSHVRSKKERCVSSVNFSSLPLILAEYIEMALSSYPDPVEQVETSRIETRHETPAETASKLCAGCLDVETSRRCSHCGGALFCSQACEQRMGLEHLLICNMREVTSADYLYDDVLADELPKDPQVRQDYWFDRCQHNSEETRLFGLFIGLLKYHYDRITREELHQWRSNPGGNPSLVARIVEKFEQLPENNRGGYFPWFLENRTRFELPDGHHSIPRPPSPETQIQNMQVKARKYLAPEDQHKEVKDLTPYAKMHCFLFYGMAADHSHPPPINSDDCQWWFDFGFVVCHDQHEERELGSMYSQMIVGSTPREENARSIGSWNLAKRTKVDPACSFDDFWKAWERGTLMTIFDKCWPSSPEEETWLTPRDDLLGRLRVFFEAERPRPSIWMLRHFLALESASVESSIPEIARAARDYGFSERLDTRTTMELKEFYVQLFKKAETLAIHQERLKGNLVQFAEGYVDIITPRVKEVLQGLL